MHLMTIVKLISLRIFPCGVKMMPERHDQTFLDLDQISYYFRQFRLKHEEGLPKEFQGPTTFLLGLGEFLSSITALIVRSCYQITAVTGVLV
jgi:hypothetical protein